MKCVVPIPAFAAPRVLEFLGAVGRSFRFFLWSMRLSPNGPLLVGLVCIPLTAESTPLWGQAGSSTPVSQPSADSVLPGDMIRLKIWREPDMSGDVAVDEQGVATLPRLGPLRVAGMRADSLKQLLIRSYAKYLRDPAIDITILRRVRILGAVRTPNVYHVEPTMTVSDALALAGGAAENGKVDEVELRRGNKYAIVKLSRGTRLSDTPLRSGDELYVPLRSWLSRNAGLVVAAVGTAVSIAYFAFRQ